MILTLDNIVLSYYEGTQLLSIQHLEFSEGIHCLWGISGSGKTSFLKLVSGRPFDAQVDGHLKLDNHVYCLASDNDMAEYNDRYVSAMYQDNFLIDDFSVSENLLLPYFLQKQDYEQTEYSFLIKTLEISDLLEKRIDQISRGEAQRVRLARALLFSQKILVLDEPLVYLDKKMKITSFDLIKTWIKDKSLIAFFSTHDQGLKLKETFSSILMFEDGLKA